MRGSALRREVRVPFISLDVTGNCAIVTGNETQGKDMNKKAIDAEQKAASWLYLGNKAAERGENAKAERHYEKAQKWLDAMNRALGNGDGSDA